MRGQDSASEHERETDKPASPPMPPPSFGQSSGWDAGQANTPPWGLSDPAPQSWQPPPAFTAAAAGMPVWQGPSNGPAPAWPAATGEPIGEPWPGHSPATPPAFPPAPPAPPPVPGPVPGPVVPGPATTAAAQEAAARDAASQEGVAVPGAPYPAPTGAPPAGPDPAQPNGIAAEPRFFLPNSATGLVPPGTPFAPAAAAPADPGGSDYPPAEPTSGPTPAPDAATAPPNPGLIPPEPTSGPTPRTPDPAPAGDAAAQPAPPDGAPQAAQPSGAPAGEWPANAPGATPETAWTPAQDQAAQGEGAAAPGTPDAAGPADEAPATARLKPRQGGRNTDPLDIPVWPPQAKAEGESAAGDVPLAETTMPVARLKPIATGEANPAAPPALPAGAQGGQPADPMGHPQTPPGADPAVADAGQGVGTQQRPTVANPILAAPTAGAPAGFSPASGPPGAAAQVRPATVAGPFIGFNAGPAPGTGGGRAPSFAPAPGTATPAPGFGTPRTGAQGTLGKKALVGAGIAVAIGAIGIGAYLAYQGLGDSSSPQAHGKVPSVVTPPQAEPTSAQPIDSEKTDAKEMTKAEAFPAAKVTVNGVTFRRVKIDETSKCEKGAAGKFATALKDNDCAKLLRATYVDGKRKYAVTTGIAVMPTRDAAVKVDGAKDLANNVWFRGLPGPAGSGGERVAISGGYAAGLVWGRYIVFSYATYADGHTPKASEKDLGPISDGFRQTTSKVIEKRASAG